MWLWQDRGEIRIAVEAGYLFPVPAISSLVAASCLSGTRVHSPLCQQPLGRRGEKQRLRTAARGYLAVLTVVGTGRLVLPEPIRSNLEDLEFERTLLDHHMISKYRKRKAKTALAAGPSDSVGLSDATSDQNSTSFSDGEIPFSNLSDDSLLTSSDVSPESFESELSARVRIDLSSDSTAASSSSVAVMSGSDEDKEMRNPAVVYVESSVTTQRDLKVRAIFVLVGCTYARGVSAHAACHPHVCVFTCYARHPHVGVMRVMRVTRVCLTVHASHCGQRLRRFTL